MRELRVPIAASFFILFLLASISFAPLFIRESHEGMLEVSFLDVGQGDATFIESPLGTQVLIDGGKGDAVLSELQKAMGFFDRDIDMVVATHPDMDHIGGLLNVLERYDVHTILLTENTSDTPVFESFRRSVDAEGAEIIYARRGQVFDLGSGERGSTTLAILFPDHDPRGLESNTSSIVAQLTYGENEYLLTGDSPKEIEEHLVRLGTSTLRSDVLKVGHHGSRTSTSEMFLRTVGPFFAIISAGKNNSYGHPHKEVTDLLDAHSILHRNTATEGGISLFSDGVDIWFR